MALPTASDNPFPSLLVTEGSAPASPAAGKQRVFIDSADHLLKVKNSSGTVSSVGGSGSGSITASGYTQSTAKILGRTTASTGAIEEITVGSGLTLSAGSLTASAGSFSSYDTLIAAMSGIVHRWKFEDASGNFADSVGSLTLTKSGTVTYSVSGGPVSGASGSVTIGASGQGVTSGLGSIPVANTARTFVLVFKGKSSASKQTLLSYGTSGSTRQWWTAYLNDNGGATNDALSLATWADDAALTQTALNVEIWHMAAFGYDAASTVLEFIDGHLLGKRLGGSLNTGTGGNFSLGIDTLGANQLGGVTLDDLAVFSRCLNPYELQQLYNALVGALP